MMQSVIIFAVTEGKTKQTKRPGRAQKHTGFGTLFKTHFITGKSVTMLLNGTHAGGLTYAKNL